MPRDTGLPRVDAEHDFLRIRRHQVLSSLAARVRGDDIAQALSFDEVVDALGVQGERFLGSRTIPIDAIVGSVDKVREFDHRFRPTSGRSRQRWEQLALHLRTQGEVPPIDVYQVGDRYFVRDGHHRVSVARAMGWLAIEAVVTQVETILTPDGLSARTDLELQRWRKLFLARVPLDGATRAEVEVTEPLTYGVLAEMVEAWAARLMHSEGRYLDRAEMARRWYAEEFQPVTAMIAEADARAVEETPAEAYVRIAGERYRLIRAHEWSDDIVAMARPRRRRPSRQRTERGDST